jgi:uncharacterized membrane protein YvbJ
MYCPSCGKENDDSGAFCQACGRPLAGVGSQAVQGRAEQTAYQSAQYRPPTPGAISNIPNYLGWAIAVLILCFWPTGIAAVVNATRVNNRLALGDVAGAQEASRKAKMWCWITFAIAIVWVVIVVIAVAVAGTPGY